MSDLPPGLGDQIGALMGGSGLSPEIQGLMSQLYPLQLAQPQAQYGLDTQLANQSYGNTIASLNIQRGALGREGRALPQQYAISKEGLVLDQSENDLQRQQLGLRGKSLDITETEERQAAQRALQGAQSSATARGAINTSGYGQQRTDINNNLQNQLAQMALSRQGVGLQGQGLDINAQRLGLSNMGADINYGLQTGSLGDQIAQLGLNYGIAGQTQQNAIGQAGVNAASGTINTAVGQIGSLGNAAQQVPGYAGQAGALGTAIPPQPSNPVGRG